MTVHLETPQPVRFRKYKTPKGIDLNYFDRFVFSISVAAGKQSVFDIVEAYRWARKRFNVGVLLLGDGLYKITLCICEGLEQLDAEVKAIGAGSELLKAFRDKVDGNCNVLRTSDLLIDPEFSHAFARVEEFSKNDVSFREAIEADACAYVVRQKLRGKLKICEDQAIALSVFYLKQEIAVYLLLAERGWLADLYLGQEIPTLAKIMTGEIPAAPEALKRRVHITLEMRKKKQAADTCLMKGPLNPRGELNSSHQDGPQAERCLG